MDWVRQINAVIRRIYQIDPSGLSDEDWANLYQEYVYTEKLKLHKLKDTFKEALIDVLNQIKTE